MAPETAPAPARAPAAEPQPAAEASKLKDMEKLFAAAFKNKASDIHLKAGLKPVLRVNTQIHEIGQRVLTADDTFRMVNEILSPDQRQAFKQNRDLDFAYSVEGVGRFRVNIFYDRGTVAMAARRVNTEIPTFEALNLPPSLKKCCEFNQGVVMIAGATGSGKSTTLACVLEHVNKTQRAHIITIEDPIEYLFVDKQSFINQREIGIDVPDFHQALKTVVRQDPDIILVGEMRDYISMEAALMASETGHLVFATIHASSASSVIGRMLELFPVERQPLIRQSLGFNLRAIICQKLVPGAREDVRVVPAIEILFNTPTATKLILEAEDKKLTELIRASEEEGMQDFTSSLLKLVNTGLITKRAALEAAPNAEALKMALKGIVLGDERRILG
jgi:twitching motility protein PilT